MKYRSNKCLAIHVIDLKKAEEFYSGVMRFKLVSKTKKQLEYKTGRFQLFINKDQKACPPIPSFSVKNITKARDQLKGAGCKIIDDRGTSLYFKDPFGFVYDLIEE